MPGVENRAVLGKSASTAAGVTAAEDHTWFRMRMNDLHHELRTVDNKAGNQESVPHNRAKAADSCRCAVITNGSFHGRR